MSGSTLILNLAYTVLLSASLFRSLFRLRIVLIVGAVGFVIYGLIEGIPTMAVWNSLNAGLHGFQLWKLIRARQSVTLTAEEEVIRQTYLPDMSTFDFFTFWSIGRNERFTEMLTEQDQPQDMLLMILDGAAEVEVDGRVIATRSAGDFIGEVSLVSGSRATATVRPIGELTARIWEHREIRALDELNPTSARAVQSHLTKALADKIAR